MKTLLSAAMFLTMFACSAIAPSAEEIVLWPNGAPGSEGKNEPEKIEKGNISRVHKPSITVFLPPADKNTGTAILVIPGGGHSKLCVGHEGTSVAERFNPHGITVFMLKHRLAREPGSTYTIMDHAVPDTQRAMRLIRSRATEWKIDPARLGAMGFSAGGELVAQISMKPSIGAADAVDRVRVMAMRAYPRERGRMWRCSMFLSTLRRCRANRSGRLCYWTDPAHAEPLAPDARRLTRPRHPAGRHGRRGTT